MVFSNTIVFAFSVVLICLILSVLINLICTVLRGKQRQKHLLLAGMSTTLLLAGVIIVYVTEHTLLEPGRFFSVFFEWLTSNTNCHPNGYCHKSYIPHVRQTDVEHIHNRLFCGSCFEYTRVFRLYDSLVYTI